jgi:hypothetical protein
MDGNSPAGYSHRAAIRSDLPFVHHIPWGLVMRQCSFCNSHIHNLWSPEVTIRPLKNSASLIFCKFKCQEAYDKKHKIKFEPPVNRTMALAVGVLAFMILMLWYLIPAHGKDFPNASETEKKFFNDLTAPNGASCCSISDCGYIENDEFRIKDGRFEVWIEDMWIPVPTDRVLHANKSPRGKPVLCRNGFSIYCFAPDTLM